MPEKVHYRSKDGMEIAAILYKPRDLKPGAKYPAVLWIHGGPEGQEFSGSIPGRNIWRNPGYWCWSRIIAAAPATARNSAI